MNKEEEVNSVLYNTCLSYIREVLKNNLEVYNEFLWEHQISTLPGGIFRKDGEEIEREEVQLLFENYKKK